MNVVNKYAIGERVYLITRDSGPLVKCKVCKGKTGITLEGEWFTCPKCGGKGKIFPPEPVWRVMKRPFIVEVIQMTTVLDELSPDGVTRTDIRYKISNREYLSIMADEDKIFKNRAEALKICKLLNRKE